MDLKIKTDNNGNNGTPTAPAPTAPAPTAPAETTAPAAPTAPAVTTAPAETTAPTTVDTPNVNAPVEENQTVAVNPNKFNENAMDNVPKTADETDLTLPLRLLIASGVTISWLAVVYVIKRKRETM